MTALGVVVSRKISVLSTKSSNPLLCSCSCVDEVLFFAPAVFCHRVPLAENLTASARISKACVDATSLGALPSATAKARMTVSVVLTVSGSA